MTQLICLDGFVFADHDDATPVNLADYPAGAVIIPWADRDASLLPCSPEAAPATATEMETPDGLARYAARCRTADTRYAPVPTTAAQLKAYAACARWYRSQAGTTVAGTRYATDDATEARITSKQRVFDADPKTVISWSAPGGFVKLDLAGFTAMAQAVAAYREACFAAQEKAEVGIGDGSLKTMAQIDAVIAAAGV